MKPQSAYIATAVLSSLVSAAVVAGKIDTTADIVTSMPGSSAEVTSHQSLTPPTYRAEHLAKRADRGPMFAGEAELLYFIDMPVSGTTFEWEEYLEDYEKTFEWTYKNALRKVGDEKHSALFDSRLRTARQMLDDLKAAAEGMKRLNGDNSPGAAELSRAYELSAIRWQLYKIEPVSKLRASTIREAKLLYDECYKVYNQFIALEDRSKQSEFEPLIQKTFAAIREVRTEVTHAENAQESDDKILA
ncbi:hypothetical protein HF325_000111 [Metschnikowia pulcherrima]|uniref:Uncharacterized protein n=1 Tax=Metschnikowia pulcherrima TaxID=27326 RepID=A0A8H7GY05_9ASCO|nr:hypothetical protein HF325_000111 [Metschnikowia pulcherrima]